MSHTNAYSGRRTPEGEAQQQQVEDSPLREWTVRYRPESVNYGIYLGGYVEAVVKTKSEADAIVKAHNAALAAERQRREQAEYWLGELLAVIYCDGGHYQSEHGIERATKDAIEKRNKLIARIDVLEYQLLSAQAAIEKHNTDLENHECWGTIRVDLSLLHQHDEEQLNEVVRLLASIFLSNGKSLLGGSPPPMWTPRLIAQVADENVKRNDAEVRKPLVDAGNDMRRACEQAGMCEAWDDALAKVRENP